MEKDRSYSLITAMRMPVDTTMVMMNQMKRALMDLYISDWLISSMRLFVWSIRLFVSTYLLA